VEHFVDLHALHHFSSVIHNILTQISQVYLGTDAVFGTSSMFISMFLCLSVLTLGWVIVRRKFRSQSNKLLLLLILFSIIVLPFVPSIISGGALPIRSLAAVPICVWAICFATSHFASCFRSLPWLICLVLADLNLSYIYCYNQTQTLIATQNDRQLAQAIIDRCSQVSKEFEPNSRIYALITYGAAAYHLPYKHRSESTLGAMVFEWDGGSPERQVNYYKVIGMPCFQLAKPTEKQKYRKKLEAMPVWPRAGSVEVTEDVVLVKLGSNCSRYWSTF
jgi:hypothetical protein